jgi:hypothetical protein
LAVAWVTFATATALARASVELTAETYNAGRYLHVGAALLLPLVAAGTEALTRRRMLLGAAALVPLAMGIPGNVDKLAHTEPIFAGNRQHIFAMAHSPFVDEVPRATALQMGPFRSPLTTGWLARQAAAGRIPEPDGVDPVRDLTATNDLVLSQETSSADRAPCPRLTAPLTLSLRSGDRIEFTGTVSVAVIEGSQESYPRQFLSRDGPTIRALAGPVEVVVRPALGQQAHACTPAAGG